MVGRDHLHIDKAKVDLTTLVQTNELIVSDSVELLEEGSDFVVRNNLNVWLLGCLGQIWGTARVVEVTVSYENQICIVWDSCSSHVLRESWTTEPGVNVYYSCN